MITGAGLGFVEVGSAAEFEEAQGDSDLWHPRRGLRIVMERAVVAGLETSVESMLSEIHDGETLVVGSTLGLAARLVRDIANVPMVSVHPAPCVLRSDHRVLPCDALPRKTYGLAVIEHEVSEYSRGDIYLCSGRSERK